MLRISIKIHYLPESMSTLPIPYNMDRKFVVALFERTVAIYVTHNIVVVMLEYLPNLPM